MSDELEQDGLDEGGGEQEQQQEQPELILGKFKNQDDLANAYQNLQREFTDKSQKLSDYEKWQAEQRQTTGPPQPEPQQNPYAQQFADALYDPDQAYNVVAGVAGQIAANYIQQYESTRTQGEANLDMIVAERESNPEFKNYQKLFVAEMKRKAGPAMSGLMDPKNAAQIAEEAEAIAYGKYMRQMASKAKDNPVDRIKFMESIGVEQPHSDGGGSGDITVGDRSMLSQLGLSKEAQKRVAERARRSEEE